MGAVTSSAVNASPCDVINPNTEPASIKVAGQTKTVASISFVADCTNLEVIKGNIQIRGAVGGVPKKEVCDPEKPKPCALPGTSKSLVVASSGPYVAMPGAHPMDENVVRKTKIPNGDIYAIAAASSFNFAETPGAAAFSLSTPLSTTPIFTAKIDSPTLDIPHVLLKRNTKYIWQIYGAGGRSQVLAAGSFQLISADDAAEIDTQMTALHQNKNTADVEKLMDQLAIYYTRDLTYEMNQLQETLRSMQ